MSEISLSNNLKQIELEINWHKENAGQSIWEIGRRLNHVKEHDLVHGQFGSWLEKIEINHRIANQFMKVAKEIPYSRMSSNLGYEALYLIATLPEDQKQHYLERAEEGDSPTVKELREQKKKNKELESQLEAARRSEEIAISQLKEERDKPPEIVEKVVEPADYQQLKRATTKLQDEIDQLEEQLSQQDENSRKYEELNHRLKEMNGQLTEGQKRLQAQKDIYRFVEESNQAIDKLSTLIYLVDENEMSINEYAREPIEKIVDDLEDICGRLNQKLSQSKVIEGEIIDG